MYFGVLEEEPGRPNSVFFSLGPLSDGFLLSDGLLGCFWVGFGTTFRCSESQFCLLGERNCVRSAVYSPYSPQTSCFPFTPLDSKIGISDIHIRCLSAPTLASLALVLLG